MKFTIGTGIEYEYVAFERLKLTEILLLETETKKIGRPMTWAQLSTLERELELAPQAERAAQPGMAMYFAVQVWLSRRRAGEELSLWDALDFELADLVHIPDPVVEEPEVSPDPTLRPPGSGRAAKSPPKVRAVRPSSKKTSKRASSDA